MTDDSILAWASGWLRDNPPGDPTFRQRFIDGLGLELKERRTETDRARLMLGAIKAWCSRNGHAYPEKMAMHGLGEPVTCVSCGHNLLPFSAARDSKDRTK